MKKNIFLFYVLILLGFTGCMNDEKSEYKLSIIVNDSSMGKVAISPESNSYTSGTIVTLTPQPAEGYMFENWDGTNSSEIKNGTIKINGNKSLKAIFAKKTFKIVIKNIPDEFGNVTVSPAKQSYDDGEELSLTPVPLSGFKFYKWIGENAELISNNKVKITKDLNLTAQFVQLNYTLTATTSPAGIGLIKVTPEKQNYEYGDILSITPTPPIGYIFAGWSGKNGKELSSENKIEIKDNTVVTADFIPENPKYTITASTPNAVVVFNPQRSKYTAGEKVHLICTPELGYAFVGWAGKHGSLVDSNNTIVITENMELYPLIEKQKSFKLNVSSSDNSFGTITKVPDKTEYFEGEIVTLKPIPVKGYSISKWEGLNGNEVKNMQITINGDKTIIGVFSIDSETDLLTSKHEFNDDNSLNQFKKYTFDSNKLNVKEETYKGDGSLDNYDVYEYDQGKLKKAKHYNQENVFKSEIQYVYNDKGFLVRENDFDESSKLSKYFTFEYNSDNTLSKRYRYSSSGNLEKNWVYTYTDGLLNTIKDYDSTLKLVEQTQYEYKDKKISKESKSDASNKLLYYYTYEYNTSGQEISKKRYTANNKVDKYWNLYYGGESYSNPPSFVKENKFWSTEEYYNSIFTIGYLNEVEISMTQSEWDSMIKGITQNPRTGDYWKAKFSFKGIKGETSIDNVGFRIRGNTTRVIPQNPDGSFNKAHFKVKFDETFGFAADSSSYKELNDRSFAKLNALNMKWAFNNEDKTLITEIYSNLLLKDVGLMAPKVGSANLYIKIGDKRVNFGIYTLLEPIDKEFFTKRLGKDNNDGNLYKCLWQQKSSATLDISTINEIGIKPENRSSKPTYDLLTNEKEANHTVMRNFITNINSLNGTDFKNYIDSNVNVDSILRTMAIDMLLGNPDDHWSMGNNLYLYFNPNGKIEFVQYDYDNSLGSGWYPQSPRDGTTTANTSILKYLQLSKYWDGREAILITKILSIQEYKDKYIEYLKKYYDQTTGIFTYDKYSKFYDVMEPLYKPYLKNDCHQGETMYKDPMVKKYFETKIESVKKQLAEYSK